MTGWKFRTRRVAGAAVVAVRALIPGGARSEELPGQALIAGRLLTEGTERRDWRRIAEEAEAKGMMVESAGGFESHGVGVDALAGDWRRALEWAAELLFEPTFPEDRCDWLRRQAAAELESLGDQPEVRTGWGFDEQLWTPHPKARPIQGTPETLATLTPEDCRGFHSQRLESGAIVTVAGDLDEEEIEKAMGEIFGRAGEAKEESRDSPAPARHPEPPRPIGLPELRKEVSLPPSDQAHLFAGHLTVKRAHPDYEALEILAIILGAGAGLTGRIPERIREREGLAYTARADTLAGAGLDPGRLVAYVGTAPATVAQAEKGVKEELERLLQDGVTDRELEEARAYLLGREPFKRETARQWADLLFRAERYRLPIDQPAWREDQLKAVDKKTLQKAARAHLRPKDLKVTVGLPAEK